MDLKNWTPFPSTDLRHVLLLGASSAQKVCVSTAPAMHVAFANWCRVAKEAKGFPLLCSVLNQFRRDPTWSRNFSDIFFWRDVDWDVDFVVDACCFFPQGLVDSWQWLTHVDTHHEYVVPGHSLLGPAPRECRGGMRYIWPDGCSCRRSIQNRHMNIAYVWCTSCTW